MTLPIRVTWTAPMPTSAGMKRKTIYVLADEDRVIRYLGSTDLTCEERFKLHKLQALKDGSASPLYRHVNANGGFDGWTIQPLCVVDYNPTLLPNAAKHQEDVCMKALRRAGHPLLNKNCAVVLWMQMNVAGSQINVGAMHTLVTWRRNHAKRDNVDALHLRPKKTMQID